MSGLAAEPKFPLTVGAIQRSKKPLPEEAAQHIDMDEKLFLAAFALFARNPTLTIR